ncbi:glycosyltransferase family 9 protein, partial [bacterium M00.F.Ca.ET.194.01.1.1]
MKPLPFEAEKALAPLGRHHIHPNAFIAVHAGASFKCRQWQPERFAEAIDEIAAETGLGVVLVGGPDEREAAARIVAGTATQVVDLVGELSLESLLAVLEQA